MMPQSSYEINQRIRTYDVGFYDDLTTCIIAKLGCLIRLVESKTEIINKLRKLIIGKKKLAIYKFHVKTQLLMVKTRPIIFFNMEIISKYSSKL